MYPGSAPPNGHPQPQPMYKLNITNLRWAEIYRASGNPFLFIIAAPIIAFCKLFRIAMTGGERFPQEISFATADVTALGQRAQEIDHLFQGMLALGFEHFSTFRVPELPYDAIVFALLNRQEQTYGDVYHIITPMKTVVYCEFVTCFADGRALTTTNNRDSVATDAPPKAGRQALHKAPPDALWTLHKARLAELLPAAGGAAGPVSAEHYSEAFRRAWRENAEHMVSRGVWVPA